MKRGHQACCNYLLQGKKWFCSHGCTGRKLNNPHRDPAWSRLQWDLLDETMPKSGGQERSQLRERLSRWTSLKLHLHTEQEQDSNQLTLSKWTRRMHHLETMNADFAVQTRN